MPVTSWSTDGFLAPPDACLLQRRSGIAEGAFPAEN